MISWLPFVAVGIVAASLYGIIHDQITARICVEYFTIGHAPLFETDSPTILGLGWGIIASWWGGAILGLGFAAVSRIGSPRRYEVGQIIRPVVFLLVVMAISALIAGMTGYLLARTGHIYLDGRIAQDVPAAKHAAFLGRPLGPWCQLYGRLSGGEYPHRSDLVVAIWPHAGRLGDKD